jgi:hypothetical protein
MINKKLLIVAPYPIAKPIHGGQKRAKAIFEFYKTIFTEVRYIGVFHRGQYPDWGKDDILLGQADLIKKIDENPHASELVSGKAIDNDIHVRSFMAKFLMDKRPDLIHIEQPYPYLGLKPLLAELTMEPKLIFGSQNTEYTMKDSIFKGLKLDKRLRESLVLSIKQLEQDLSRSADLVIAVNDRDAKVHKEMGASNCLVVPNGIEKRRPTEDALKHWEQYKSNKKIKNVITFVSGGHPPNWQGFLDTVGTDTSFIPKNSKILIAGGVSDYFKNEFSDRNKFSKFWLGVEPIGAISEDRLGALLSTSDVVLLPIKSGGGSNLKTAEAILSRKKIVATKYAIRGFEPYKDLPNIYVADSNQEYNRLIIKTLNTPYTQPSAKEVKLSERVQWKYCLEPLRRAVEDLVYAKHRRLARRLRRVVIKKKSV